MSFSLISAYPFQNFYGFLNPNCCTIPRWRKKFPPIRCCTSKAGGSMRSEKNYYELLGVSVDSDTREIKEAYRKLQKKYHPDIAGKKGHEHTLMLNEAYKVLMKEDLRRQYDVSIGELRMRNGKSDKVMGFSSWQGPMRPQALFVDENACIGCRECVYNASNTFVMDETLGCARVKVQFGDDGPKIQVSVDSCPMNCIHWVDSEELAVLEYLSQPKLKEGYGVFGQGWERPKNVFSAAKSFNKQMKQQTDNFQSNIQVEEETPAQAEARANASAELERERFSSMWSSLRNMFGFRKVESE